MLHIYCGDGKGKTTASIGLAVRMAGYKKKVLFIQFLKGSFTGELEILENSDYITVMRCNREYGFFCNMSDNDKESIAKNHNENLLYALRNMDKYDMIVLDEVIASYNLGVVDETILKQLVGEYKDELVMTGRNPDEWLVEKADYVSEIKKIKHPFDCGTQAREGIEY